MTISGSGARPLSLFFLCAILKKVMAAEPWTTAALAVVNNKPLKRMWMQQEIRPYLLALPLADARALYADLCKIQIAVYEETTPTLSILEALLDWSNRSYLCRFTNFVMANGKLIELVADCIDIPSPEERRKRWSELDAEWDHAFWVHKRDSDWIERMSAFRVASRETNLAAYESVKLRSADHGDSQDWRRVIVWSPERLARLPRAFWRGMRVGNCTPEEKSALIHKLTLCQSYSSVPKDIATLRDFLIAEQFVRYQREFEGLPRRRRARFSRLVRRRLMPDKTNTARLEECKTTVSDHRESSNIFFAWTRGLRRKKAHLNEI